MSCTECALTFFNSPANLAVSIISFSIAIMSLTAISKWQLSTKRKMALVYLNAFTITLPFVLYSFTTTCAIAPLLAFCSSIKPVLLTILLTLLLSLFVGYFSAPLLLRLSGSSTKLKSHPLNRFVAKAAIGSGTSAPSLYLLDRAEPVAFSFKGIGARIFISVGLAELLSKKELEAVLLHEIGHIKHGTPFLKFSALLHRLFSPLWGFSPFTKDLMHEERAADAFAASVQGTIRNIASAKRKINSYRKLATAKK